MIYEIVETLDQFRPTILAAEEAAADAENRAYALSKSTYEALCRQKLEDHTAQLLADLQRAAIFNAKEWRRAAGSARWLSASLLETAQGTRSLKLTVELEDGAFWPQKAYPSDAGFDLFVKSVEWDKHHEKPPVYDTGVHVLIPEGYVGVVTPRSSLSAQGYTCPVGIIDAGYTGSIKVVTWEPCLLRESAGDRVVPTDTKGLLKVGERLAQLVIMPKPSVELVEGKVRNAATARGERGFGSTGLGTMGAQK